MTSRDLVGICDEATTYRDGFRYPTSQLVLEEIHEPRKASKPPKKVPLFAESYDTLQKLDRSKGLPFDALWRDKEIVGTKPGEPLGRVTPLEKQPRVSRFRSDSREWANPAINLDDVEDPEMRKIIVDYTYKTTRSQSSDEIRRNWKRAGPRLSDTMCEDQANPVSLKVKLIPDLPAGFKGAAKKWDFLQDRVLVEDHNLLRSGEANEKSTKIEGKIDLDDCEEIVKLIENDELRLAYMKLPLSYGGHRTPLALGVNLDKKTVSSHRADSTV